MLFRVAVLFAFSLLCSCASLPEKHCAPLTIPYTREAIDADGILNESCYQTYPPMDCFVVAGDPSRLPPKTRAWLFWNEDALVCTFKCEDDSPAFLTSSTDEREVDIQDRAEIFIWHQELVPVYYCIEAAPGGAVHDYEARFYRKFDDCWSPEGGWEYSARRTSAGYNIEMVFPQKAMEAMGIHLCAGCSFQLGLFRADYDALDGTPVWITWVDHGREPDFHTADSFGTAVLAR